MNSLRVAREFNPEQAWFEEVKDIAQSSLKDYGPLEFSDRPTLTVMGKDEFESCARTNDLDAKAIGSIAEDLGYNLVRYASPSVELAADSLYVRKNSKTNYDRSQLAVKFYGDDNLINDRNIVTSTIDAATKRVNDWPPDYVFNLQIGRINRRVEMSDLRRINRRIGGLALPKTKAVFGQIVIESIKY